MKNHFAFSTLRKLAGALLVFAAVPAFAENLTLSAAEARALAKSFSLQAAQADLDEARQEAEAQNASLFPRLTFDVRYGYTAIIPSINLPPPMPTFPFGSNNSYSIGPTLSYTLWDQGAARKAKQSLSLLADSRSEMLGGEREKVLSETRAAYARLQLAFQELQLVKESLSLSETQRRDIRSRFGAGAASQLDEVSAQSDVLSFQLRLAQSRASARAAMVDLYASINDLEHLPGSIDSLQVDALESTLRHFDDAKLYRESSAWQSNPALKAQRKSTASADAAVESQHAAYYPLVQMQARASLDYPDGPDLSQIQQKTIALTLSMPLYEFGRTGSLVDAKQQAANAAKFREKKAEVDAARDWRKSVEQIDFLRDQQSIAADSVVQSERSAKLNYQTYKAGRISITDVQNANLRWLEARVQLARVNAQLLSEMLNLNALTGRDLSHE